MYMKGHRYDRNNESRFPTRHGNAQIKRCMKCSIGILLFKIDSRWEQARPCESFQETGAPTQHCNKAPTELMATPITVRLERIVRRCDEFVVKGRVRHRPHSQITARLMRNVIKSHLEFPSGCSYQVLEVNPIDSHQP